MITLTNLFAFALASLIMVLSPGPNMIYLVSRTLSQGKKAGVISLVGVMFGFLFHISMVSFGLTALFFAIPLAFVAIKSLGVLYLVYLAYNSIKSKNKIFEANKNLKKSSSFELFNMGLLTNILNPKMAFFYLSFFPQFINPEHGSVLSQSLTLGSIQILISFTINLLIVIFSAKMAIWFSRKPVWLSIQKWLMASVLTALAVKMTFTKSHY